MALPERPKMPSGVLVVAGLVIGFFLYRMVGFVLGTVFFVIKLGLVALVLAGIAAVAMRGSPKKR